MKPIASLTVLLTIVVFGQPPAGATPSDAGSTTVTYRLQVAIRHLTVASETHQAGYDRDTRFGEWASQGGGCDTRAVVLQQESKIPVVQNENCTVETGRWRSYYNATTYTRASDLQIDHVVPVANVWATGAWRWDQATRVAYYNDLSDPRTLVAVDAHDNEAKGDRTPNEWLPPAHQCRYIRDYVSIKLRWQLTVTRPEKKSLRSVGRACLTSRVSYDPVPITSR